MIARRLTLVLALAFAVASVAGYLVWGNAAEPLADQLVWGDIIVWGNGAETGDEILWGDYVVWGN